MERRILRFKQVTKLISMSKSSIYRMINNGEIKPPFTITGRTVGFLESDIQDFINKKANIQLNKGDNNE